MSPMGPCAHCTLTLATHAARPTLLRHCPPPFFGSVTTQLGLASTASVDLSASVCASVTANSQCSTFESFTGVITGLASSVVAPSADLLSSSAQSLGNTINSWPIENIKQSISLAGLCVLAIVAGVIFFQAMLLCPSRCANYSFKFLSFFSLTLSALVYIVAGVFLVVGVLGSDGVLGWQGALFPSELSTSHSLPFPHPAFCTCSLLLPLFRERKARRPL